MILTFQEENKDILVCVESMGVHVPCAGVEPGVSPPRDTPGSTPAQGTWTPIPFLSPHSTGARREMRALFFTAHAQPIRAHAQSQTTLIYTCLRACGSMNFVIAIR